MLFLVVGVGFAGLLWISFLVIRELNTEPNSEWRELSLQRLAVEDELGHFLTRRSSSVSQTHPPCSHPQATAFWEGLRGENINDALSIAEESMISDRENSQSRLLLAMALLENRDFDAANDQLMAAISRGASGSFSIYLSTRIEIEQYLESIAEQIPTSDTSILMPAELLALELHLRLGDRNDAASLWIPGQSPEVSQEDARSFVVSHFSGYYRLARSMLTALQEEEYGEGLYLLGQIALKCGFSKEGITLLNSVEETMKTSHQRRSYLRNIALLRGERPISAESLSSGHKRIKLNVLN